VLRFFSRHRSLSFFEEKKKSLGQTVKNISEKKVSSSPAFSFFCFRSLFDLGGVLVGGEEGDGKTRGEREKKRG
jgi:hypothetical protein